jgi:hypothetical protein
MLATQQAGGRAYCRSRDACACIAATFEGRVLTNGGFHPLITPRDGVGLGPSFGWERGPMLRLLLHKIDGPPAGYYAPRFGYALQMGEDAARGMSADWPAAQQMLQGIWRQEAGGVDWPEARPVIHYAWRLTREAMAKEAPWTRG